MFRSFDLWGFQHVLSSLKKASGSGTGGNFEKTLILGNLVGSKAVVHELKTSGTWAQNLWNMDSKPVEQVRIPLTKRSPDLHTHSLWQDASVPTGGIPEHYANHLGPPKHSKLWYITSKSRGTWDQNLWNIGPKPVVHGSRQLRLRRSIAKNYCFFEIVSGTTPARFF